MEVDTGTFRALLQIAAAAAAKVDAMEKERQPPVKARRRHRKPGGRHLRLAALNGKLLGTLPPVAAWVWRRPRAAVLALAAAGGMAVAVPEPVYSPPPARVVAHAPRPVPFVYSRPAPRDDMGVRHVAARKAPRRAAPQAVLPVRLRPPLPSCLPPPLAHNGRCVTPHTMRRHP